MDSQSYVKARAMIEYRHPTLATQKNVMTASGNQCAFPGCSRLIFDLEHETLIGTVAHIKARKENGPRFDKNQSEEDNRSFANLVAMCAEHSKIIDGPRATDFSVETLTTWKTEHEGKIANDSDRSWIRPANSLTRLTSEGETLHFSYWIDRTGRPRLFRREQLAAVNVLMSINLMLNQVACLPERLQDASNADVRTVLQQSWAKFTVETSVFADLCMLMAMVPNITFAEFLAFMIERNDPSEMVSIGAKRIAKMATGQQDPIC